MGEMMNAEWCEAMALSQEDATRYIKQQCKTWPDEQKVGCATVRRISERGSYMAAAALRIAAAALRWYAKTETGGDDHAERQALIAACREATNG